MYLIILNFDGIEGCKILRQQANMNVGQKTLKSGSEIVREASAVHVVKKYWATWMGMGQVGLFYKDAVTIMKYHSLTNVALKKPQRASDCHIQVY